MFIVLIISRSLEGNAVLLECGDSKGVSPRWAALLETGLNFIHTCPCQTKDKIMLLIQKLEEKKQY
jgi:hypothetical protein